MPESKQVKCKVLQTIRENGKVYKAGDELVLDEARAKLFAGEKVGHVQIIGPADTKSQKKA